jgi:hypothetical protein
VAAPTWTRTERTRNLIAAAAEVWRRGLVDVSAGNKRRFYEPLRVGTLRTTPTSARADGVHICDSPPGCAR